MTRLALEKVYDHSSADNCATRGEDQPLRNYISGPTFGDGSEKKLSGLTASAAEVAAALGLKEASFRRKARAMHTEHGFPLPLRGSSWTWSVRAVANWIKATGAIEQKETLDTGNPRDAMEQQEEVGAAIVLAQHRTLRERYAGRA